MVSSQMSRASAPNDKKCKVKKFHGKGKYMGCVEL